MIDPGDTQGGDAMAGSGEVEVRSPATDWARPFAQERLDDEVVAAGLFAPNAPGRCEFSSLDAFGQRQILKSQGRHHGERIVVALTALHIHALSLSMTGRVLENLTWDRSTARVVAMPARPGVIAPGPAVFVGSPTCFPAIEVVERGGSGTTAMLLAGRRAHSVARP
jgi:hypothetical protein